MTAASQRALPSRSRWLHATPRHWLGAAVAAASPWLLATTVLTQQEPAAPAEQSTPPEARAAETLTREEREVFLLKARIVRARPAPKGITGSHRITLSDGRLTHDAHVQSIDEALSTFQGRRGVELNFRDSWRFNVAAYRLSVLLGMDMVPVTVERIYKRAPSSFTWWVDDVMMDEGTRVTEKRRAPDVKAWGQQMAVVRVFDELIYNTDRNFGNLLITSDWQLWMIDHTRAFRRHRTLRTATHLTGCDRALLARLEALDKATIHRELARWLELPELEGLVGRREAILQFFKTTPASSIFDLPPRGVVVH